jgi:sulfatase modifying factor 1
VRTLAAAVVSLGLLSLAGCEGLLGLGGETDAPADAGDAGQGPDGTVGVNGDGAGQDDVSDSSVSAAEASQADVMGTSVDAEGEDARSGDASRADSSATSPDSGVDAGVVCAASICTQIGTVCQDGQTLATCAVGGNGCEHVASTSMCPAPQSCSGAAPSAGCALTCTDSCASGQASCVSGSLAKCVLGSNGCWAYGTPAACGTRQTCTGSAGSATCTCNTDPVCSAADKVCTSTSTLATCAADSQGCFYESTSSTCGASQTCLTSTCGGVCGPGQINCSGQQPQTCGANGQWQNTGAACGSSQTCVNGVCGGVCGPGQVTCAGSQPQSCGTNGQWQNTGSSCSNATGSFCSNASCKTAPSCAASGAGSSSCGSASESCCTSPEVASGTFDRLYTNSGGGATGESNPASVSQYRLDKYEVTVARFRQFVAAWNGGAGFTPPAGSGKHTHLNGGQGLANSGSAGTYEPGWVTSDNSNVAPTNANLADAVCDSGGTWSTWTPAAGSNENLPINCVNWYEAYAFCIWDGGFLPSETESEYAAAGGSQQREYPWGSTAPGSANQYAIYSCNYPSGSGSCNTGPVNMSPVGTATLGVGLWGQLDLTGNMQQWTLDWLANFVNPCTDCAYTTAAADRVVKGGAWDTATTALLLPTVRYSPAPPTRSQDIGFRCARSP